MRLRISTSNLLIHQLVEACQDWKIPRFQRKYVWKQEHRQLLVSSITEGIPIGRILLWQRERYAEPFILDGQQRITSMVMMSSSASDVDDLQVVENGPSISFSTLVTKSLIPLRKFDEHDAYEASNRALFQNACDMYDVIRTYEINVTTVIGDETYARYVFNRINTTGVPVVMGGERLDEDNAPTIAQQVERLRDSRR